MTEETNKPGLKTILGDDFFHLQRAVAHEVNRNGKADALHVSGEALLQVTYRVSASVRVRLEDQEIAEHRPIRVTTKGDWADPSALVIEANGELRERLNEEDVEEKFMEHVVDNIPEDIDDYHVEIDYVEYDDHYVDSLEIDEDSLADVEAWNEKAAEESTKDE